jgi:hypothetical protein
MNLPRRLFIARTLSVAAAAASARAFAQSPTPMDPVPQAKNPIERVRRTHDVALAAEFVGAAHRDLEKVKVMVAKEPRLVFASVDTGNIGIGDWESGLNGAAHTGQCDIALFLLSQGARIDAFCAAMLGYRDVVTALIKADPLTATGKGPHNITLLYHAAISGDVTIAEAIKPHLPAGANDYNGALSAAARDGRLEFTKWLLTNGATNVNAPDGFRKTPLKIALEKGFADVASLLRKHGGREAL